MRRATLVILATLLITASVFAQAPGGAPATPPATPPASASPPQAAPPRPAAPAPAGAAVGASKIAVIDFARAVTQNAEGKKANEQFSGELAKRQSSFEAKQKKAGDIQTRLATGEKLLAEDAKADLSRQLGQLQTEMTRDNEDAQRELGELQQRLFAPVMDRVQRAVREYSTEMAIAVVFDVSGQADNIVHYDDVADITTEIIRRVDAAAPKTPAAPAGTPARPNPPTPDPTKKP